MKALAPLLPAARLPVSPRVLSVAVLVGLLVTLCSCATRGPSDSTNLPHYAYPTGTGSSGLPSAVVAESAEFGWPRVLTDGSTTNLVYAPRVDSWDGHWLIGRSAVSIQAPGQSHPVYGVVTLKAVTLVDKTARLVSLDDIQLSGGDFPSARQNAERYLSALREKFPKHLQGLRLDDLEESFLMTPQPLNGSSRALNNNPPKIIVSTKPAILVSIDGSPVYRPVPGTGLERVINTRVLLLRDKGGGHYLHFLDGYLKAPALDGPWTAADRPPAGAAEAEKGAAGGVVPVDLLEAQGDAPTRSAIAVTNAALPVVYVTTKPAELIILEGEPQFVPIANTHLLYAANTTGNVFKLTTDQRTYVLISGRWFSALTFDGPWRFVPGSQMPVDFANIPDTSPKENVKASIPGTEQATEALIDNSIPESTKVARTTPMQDPHIDGPPQLRPIFGTPLQYVVNSGTPIIKIDEHTWYACQNGVWFAATDVSGPWAVATSVPPVIYTIPPSSPLHYLTYVQVYGATPDSVYAGYTPGYLGTEVEPDGAVVYGTGYYYPPWVGTVWYGWPMTWGFGWGPCWTPWDDWCFDIGFGWGCGFGAYGWWHCHPVGPWWGPYRHWGHWGHDGGFVASRGHDPVTTAGRIYSRPNSRFSSTRPVVSHASLTYGRAYNSRTGALAGGQRAAVQNVFAAGAFSNPSGGALRGRGPTGAWEPAYLHSSASQSRSWSPGFAGAGAHFSGGAGAGAFSRYAGGGGGYYHGGGFSHGAYGGRYGGGGWSGGHGGGGWGGGGHGGGGWGGGGGSHGGGGGGQSGGGGGGGGGGHR